jgi:hypothetical protein
LKEPKEGEEPIETIEERQIFLENTYCDVKEKLRSHDHLVENAVEKALMF